MDGNIIFSCIVYGFMAWLFYLMGYTYSLSNGKSSYTEQAQQYFPLIVVAVVFVLVSGLRENTGSDTVMYVDNYNQVVRNPGYINDHDEIGWIYLMHFFARLGLHSSVFLGFAALIQISSLLYFTHKFPSASPYLLLLFIITGEFANLWNGIRQEVASYVTLSMVFVLMDKKKFSFIIFVTVIYLLSFIHKSSLALLVLWPLFRLKRFILPNKYWFLALWIIFTVLGRQRVWTDYLVNLELIAPLVGYEYNNDLSLAWIEGFDEQNIGFRTLAQYFFSIVIILLGRSFAANEREKKNQYVVYFFNLASIYLLSSSLFHGARMLERLFMYFQPYFFIFMAFLLNDFLLRKKTRLLGLLIIALFFMVLFSSVITSDRDGGIMYNTILFSL